MGQIRYKKNFTGLVEVSSLPNSKDVTVNKTRIYHLNNKVTYPFLGHNWSMIFHILFLKYIKT